MINDWRYDPGKLVSSFVLLSGYAKEWQLEANTNGGGQTRYRIVLDNSASEWYHDPVQAMDEGIVLARKR
jgi:hypothetical protein